MADQDLTCSECGGTFNVAKSTAEELNFAAFCPFCGHPIALAAPSSTEEAPSGPGADMKTTTWDSTEAALGRPVAVVAPATGAPAGMVPLALTREPSAGHTKMFEEPSEGELELDLEAIEVSDQAAASGPEVRWRLEVDGERASDRATILKRIRNGELGPRDLAAPEGSSDEPWRELSEIPEFRRYVMLFGRTGSPKDPTKDPFWKRVKRP